MSLARRELFPEITPLREAIDRLLEQSVVGLGRFDVFGRTFPMDVRETDGEYIVEASLPGMKPEDVQVMATENMLTIRATKKEEEKTEKPGVYVRHERYEGELSRSITLPTSIKAENVVATYEHGVLTLHIPKAEIAKAQQIKIQIKEPIVH